MAKVFSALFILCLTLGNYAQGQVRINEACTSNSGVYFDEDGDARDWIEMYNPSSDAINLSGYYLTDKRSDTTKWQFGNVLIPANSFTVVFASDKNRPNQQPPHTSFKLSQSGESIWLFSPAKELVDSMTIPFISTDYSFGSFPDGSSERYFFATPTPLGSNNSANPLDRIVALKPTFNVGTGVFKHSFHLEILSNETVGTILYTTDGSEPTINSQEYTTALAVHGNSVIRARVFAPNLLPSEVVTGSYIFVDQQTLPIVSLTTHPGYFFDADTGIYVMGPNASPDFPYYGANFWSDTEVPVNVQWIDKYGRLGFDQTLGVRIHGGTISRTRPMRSLRLLADEHYGKGEIEYPLFSTKIQPKNKRFILRNSGSDYLQTMFRDGFIHNVLISNGLHVDAVCYNPVEVYLNGAFWGIHNAREKVDRYYIQSNFGYDDNDVDMLEEQDLIMEGDFTAFNTMEAQLLSLDVTDNDQFIIADSLFDVLNIADYYIAQTYINNLDWPYNNLKYWRARVAGAKWRYIIFDLDATLGGVSFAPVEFDALNRALGSFGDTNRHVIILRKLLENRNYFEYYINRYCDLANTVFSAKKFSEAADVAAQRIEAVVPRHFERWSPEENHWEEAVEVVKTYVEERPPFAMKYLQEFYELAAQSNLHLNVYPPQAGKIELNSISVREFPFEGIYFEDVPISVGVTENQGFVFSHWETNRTDISTVSMENSFLPQNGDSLTAVFIGNSVYKPLKVFPNPAVTDVTIEFVVNGKQQVNVFLSGIDGRTKSQLYGQVLHAGTHQLKLTLPSSNQGVYVLTVITKTDRFTEKLIVAQ